SRRTAAEAEVMTRSKTTLLPRSPCPGPRGRQRNAAVVEEDSTGTSVARLVVMSTREIPKDQWQGALDRFSRDHEGCVARISITPRDRPLQIDVLDLPLQCLFMDYCLN